MATVALNMIVKDELENAETIILHALPVFDEINIVVSDKPTANKLKKEFDDPTRFDRVHIKWREWNNRFDQARNAALEMTDTDYMFWIDADDYFDFTTIPQLLELAVAENLDVLFLPYNYAQDEDGNCVTKQYRERLLRLGSGFTWKGWVHETPIWPDDTYSRHILDSPVVTHHMAPGHTTQSIDRNHAILAEAYLATDDPRYIYYFGMSLFTKQEYDKSIKVLNEYLKVGGSVEDIYRALSVISECAYHIDKFDLALEFASKCTILKPEYPMGYWLLAQYEADQKNWEQALEWVKVSLTKPDPVSLSVWDPSARDRAILIAAQAEFMLQHYNNALAWLRKIPNNRSAQELLDGFTEEADAETFIKLLPRIRKYFEDDKTMYEALCHDMRFDPRLKSLRFTVKKPFTWGSRSIVILCGEGYEEWGPQTLDRGMGGSEEAVVYLTRELAKLGWNVTVYAEAEYQENFGEHYVRWLPWREFDVRDTFNVFVGWRAPQFVEPINAKVKLVDVHDLIPKETVKPYDDTLYMFKSNYHKEQYPDLPAEKSRVVGNGIKKDQFHEDTK